MSTKAMTDVLERAIGDPVFREQLKTDCEAAVKGYDLTADEIAALKKGDETGLRAIGVEERLSKWYFYR